MKPEYIAALTASVWIIAITGCSTNTDPRGNNDNTSTNPSNVIKVLDRVRCHESYSECLQSDIDDIWNACLRDGFTSTAPTQVVKASREITELVQETREVTKTRPKKVENIDENGIVTELEGSEEYTETVNTKGYCMGTEYIF